MTVPITPGPWSFLANIGQGIANYGEGKARFRAEKMKQVGTIFAAVQNDELSANVLKSPFFQSLIKDSGIGEQFSPDFVAPKPKETLARGQEEALGQVLPQILNPSAQGPEDQFARQQLAAEGTIATAPQRAKAREDTARSTTVAQTIEGGGPAGRAAAGVQSQQVAGAAEQAAIQPIVQSAAGRSVDASLSTLKIDRITPENIANISDAAWGLAQSDAASKGYTLDESLTRPYIDAAIQARVRAQEEMDVKRIAAENAGGGASDNSRLIDFYQRQQQRVNDAIRSLPVPTLVQTYQAGEITKNATNTGRSVEEVLADPTIPLDQKIAYRITTDYNTQLPLLQREAEGYRDQLGQLLFRRIPLQDLPAAPPPSSPARTQQPGGGANGVTPSASTTDTGANAAYNERLRKASGRLAELRAQNNKLPKDKQRSDDELKKQAARENNVSLTLPAGGNRR